MDSRSRSLLAGQVVIIAIGIIFTIFSVRIVFTPMIGEEEYVGISFKDLQATNPKLANSLWHYSTAIGIIVAGVNLLIAMLAWKGLSKGSTLARYSWLSMLILSLTFAVALLLAHVPIGHIGFAHVGIQSILTLLYLVGLGVSAKAVFSKQ